MKNSTKLVLVSILDVAAIMIIISFFIDPFAMPVYVTVSFCIGYIVVAILILRSRFRVKKHYNAFVHL